MKIARLIVMVLFLMSTCIMLIQNYAIVNLHALGCSNTNGEECPAPGGRIWSAYECGQGCASHGGCNRAERVKAECYNCLCNSEWMIYCNNGESWEFHWQEYDDVTCNPVEI